MFRKRAEKDLGKNKIVLAPGDTLSVTETVGGATRRVLHKETIGQQLEVDRIATFDAVGELGVDVGIAVILGKAMVDQ